MDLECNGMCGDCFVLQRHLAKAYELGMVTMEEIDNAVKNVLTARFKLGMFDPANIVPFNKISPDIVGCENHKNLALEVARQSIVLLKNKDEILPLNINKTKSIAVIGHNANECVFGDYSGTPLNEPVSPLQGIKQFVGKKVKINYVDTKLKTHDLVMVPAKYLVTQNSEKGLKATYFNNKNLNGKGKHALILKLIFIAKITHRIHLFQKVRNLLFGKGFIIAPTDGEYMVGVSSDDGFRLYLNDELKLDYWINRGETLNKIKLNFEENKKYKIKIEWYDDGGDAACRLWWKIPGGKVVIIKKSLRRQRRVTL